MIPTSIIGALKQSTAPIDKSRNISNIYDCIEEHTNKSMTLSSLENLKKTK